MGAIVRYLHEDREVAGGWKYRRGVSEALREYFPGNISAFVRRLGKGKTSDLAIINGYQKAHADFEAMKQAAEKRRDGAYDELSADLVTHLIEIERNQALESDEQDRMDEAGEATLHEAASRLLAAPETEPADYAEYRWERRQETLEGVLVHYRDLYAKGRTDPAVTFEVRDMCAAQGLHVDPDSLGFRRLTRAYLEASIEIIEAKLARQGGQIVPTPPIPQERVEEVQKQGETIRQMAEGKLAWEKNGPSTVQATETALRLFEGMYGDMPMANITARHVSDWALLLTEKPKEPAKEHRRLGLKELVALYSDKPEFERVGGKTVNTHVGHLRSVWNWARKRGYVSRDLHNPFAEQDVPEEAPPPNEGFTTEQLNAMFNLPVFASGERPARGRGEAAFWVPLLLLQYGLRPEEVCQLLVSDIGCDDDSGEWFLRITDIGEHPVKGERSLKATTNVTLQRRVLPIPKSLIALGFLDYVKALRDAGEAALFPLLTVTSRRNMLHAKFGEWWARYVREHGALPPTGNKPLRDFRHTWTTAATRSGLTEEEREWIQGHYATGGSTNNRKYGIRDFGPRLDAVAFKGLDLSHLVVDGAIERAAKLGKSW